jgi:hypothetical protein
LLLKDLELLEQVLKGEAVQELRYSALQVKDYVFPKSGFSTS